MDIKITYETLFDLLRKERSSTDLQLLDDSFWMDIIEYIELKEKEVKEKTGLGEIERIKLQIKNVKRIIQEIYEKREKKILNIALNVVRTDTTSFIDTQNMLKEEESLFKDSIKLLKKYKRDILMNVFDGVKPNINQKPIISSSEIGKENMEFEESNEEIPECDIEIPEEVESNDKNQTEIVENKDVLTNEISLTADEEGRIKVKFLSSVPKFLGRNKNVFGPFNEGDKASLPENVVQILLKKGKVVAE